MRMAALFGFVAVLTVAATPTPTKAQNTEPQLGLSQGRPGWQQYPCTTRRACHPGEKYALRKGLLKGKKQPDWLPRIIVEFYLGRVDVILNGVPYSGCRYSVGQKGCTLTVIKGDVKRDFKLTGERDKETVVDVPRFLEFVGGPEPFELVYSDEKFKPVRIEFPPLVAECRDREIWQACEKYVADACDGAAKITRRFTTTSTTAPYGQNGHVVAACGRKGSTALTKPAPSKRSSEV